MAGLKPSLFRKPYDGMALSVDGNAQFSAILWLTSTIDGVQNRAGTLHAFAATNLAQELWNSDLNAARDGLGNLAKYTSPTVANGKVYVPTFSHSLMVYGLLTQKQLIGEVVNSASGLGGAVAPGELVVVYGSGLGPSHLTVSSLDTTGRLSTTMAGTQVLFNNVAAPLIYVRADQIAAVVPNAVATQKNAGVQVRYQAQVTPPFSTPVAETVPGLFTLDQSGQGQGAILNQDGTINTRDNPASRGSIVSLFATGQGPSDPDWAEDEIASYPLPKPLNPVTVAIGGQRCDLLYAGAAPGMAAVIQINARVPAGITPGNAVPVVVTIGSAHSQSGVTLAAK
jgi:uncharacterized protein (TIGR03437 family)